MADLFSDLCRVGKASPRRTSFGAQRAHHVTLGVSAWARYALPTLRVLTANPVYADKPDHAGGKKHERGDRDGRDGKHRDRNHGKRSHSDKKHFDDHHRKAVSQYYEQEHRGGRCPPGLARKNNGCMPPGQAKKWSKGKPLPRDVVYYDVPQTLTVKLGTPPAGHK